ADKLNLSPRSVNGVFFEGGPASSLLLVLAQEIEKGGGGGREISAAPMRSPEDSIVRQTANGNGHQRPSLQLFANTHARHERQTDALLHESFDRLDGRELERDIQRRVLRCKGFDYFEA